MIPWQDLVISIANLIFLVSLFSQVVYGFKRKKGLIILANSLPTSLGLYAMALAFFTLELYLSTTMAAINATLWFTLLIQRLVYKKA